MKLTYPAVFHKDEDTGAYAVEVPNLPGCATGGDTLADAIADELKASMTAAGQDKMIIGEYKLSYTDAKRETLDKKRLQADLGDLSDYIKVSQYKVFKVA